MLFTQKAAKPTLCYLLSTLLLFLSYSCTPDARTSAVPEFSGKEMFRQIVLFEPSELYSTSAAYESVGAQLDALEEDQRSAIKTFNDQVVRGIETMDEDYFASFKRAMQSSDPYMVEQELGNAGQLVFSVLKNSGGYDELTEELDLFIAKKADKYDFNDPEQIRQFQTDMQTHIEAENPEILLVDDNQKAIFFALAVAVVVAAVVWEAAAFVNVVAVATVGVYAAAVTKTIGADVLEGKRADHTYEQEEAVAAIIDIY